MRNNKCRREKLSFKLLDATGWRIGGLLGVHKIAILAILATLPCQHGGHMRVTHARRSTKATSRPSKPTRKATSKRASAVPRTVTMTVTSTTAQNTFGGIVDRAGGCRSDAVASARRRVRCAARATADTGRMGEDGRRFQRLTDRDGSGGTRGCACRIIVTAWLSVDRGNLRRSMSSPA